jgi:peptide deformylase
MYNANGVGLAAPQVGVSIRLFVVDASPFAEDDPELAGYKKIFINAEILNEEGMLWKFNEGCLSVPTIREDIERKKEITIRYRDENFELHEETLSGLRARVVQHEYDHIEGILFTDRMSQLKKTLLKGKLQNISKGNVKVDYRMKFPTFRK